MYAVSMAIAVGVGAALYLDGKITIGTVYLIFAYTQMLDRPLDQIVRQLQDVQTAAAGVARAQQILATRSAIEDGRGDTLPRGPLAVSFDRVTFGYGEDDPVLHELSFEVRPGAVLGLLGRTGSGKTTVARLLFRLYDPRAGSARLSGVDLRDTHLATLRSRVGLVTQDIQLFHATVRDNLTFFDRTIPDERIEAVLRDLGLGGWLAGLRAGFDTMLSSGSSRLSAGEAQLLAFARVFLRDPGLVILDEASSRLDPATEQQIERAVDRLLAGRTGIVIAHRLGTIRRADDVVILEGGRVLEAGPRERLAREAGSHFSRLLRAGQEATA
jgi:ABC-type multidrug transport system fused ATPase/permease subunit